MDDFIKVILKKSWAAWWLLPAPFLIGDPVLWWKYNSHTLDRDLIAQALVPVAVLGSLGVIGFLLKDLFERARGDHLEISSGGIVDSISKLRLGAIRWDEVAELRVLRNNAARIDIEILEHSQLRRRVSNANGIVTIYSLAMTEQQEKMIRRLRTQTTGLSSKSNV